MRNKICSVCSMSQYFLVTFILHCLLGALKKYLRYYLAMGLLLISLVGMAVEQNSEQKVQQLTQRIEQLSAEIKTAVQNKQGDLAKDLRSERSELQTQLRDIKQGARAAQKAADKNAKRAAAERQWETYPADKKLCSAIEYNRFDLVKKVMETGEINLQENNSACLFPLGDAAARGHLDIAEYLLQKKSPLAMRAPHFQTLISAVDSAAAHKEDRTAMLALLKKYGATAADSRQQSLPSAMVAEGGAEGDRQLKEKHNVSGEELAQGGSLLRALDKGHPNNVRWLLANGAQPEESALGRTALMAAVEANSLDKVQALVEAGASVNRRGLNYSSVLRYAEKRRDRVAASKKAEQERIINYLKSKGATYSEREAGE